VSAALELVAVIEGVRKIDGEATLLGHTYILGVLHHAWFIQVDESSGRQLAVGDPCDRLGDLHQFSLDGGPFETIPVDGFPGLYVLAIVPAVR
jgi:hypothetical protein